MTGLGVHDSTRSMVMSSPEGSSRDAALFQPNKSLTKDLQGFTQKTCEQARLVLTKRMPEKILYVTELIKVCDGRPDSD